MTVRQGFYREVGAGIVAKTENEYKRTVLRLLVETRRKDRIPYSWIADNTRWMRKPRRDNPQGRRCVACRARRTGRLRSRRPAARNPDKETP
jgi:hypothetical protein